MDTWPFIGLVCRAYMHSILNAFRTLFSTCNGRACFAHHVGPNLGPRGEKERFGHLCRGPTSFYMNLLRILQVWCGSHNALAVMLATSLYTSLLRIF